MPQAVKACLWSYDTTKFDIALPAHRMRIIRNILDRGTEEAVTWLRENFSDAEITEAIRTSASSEWGAKSLALWSLVFNVRPAREGRFI